MDVTRLTHDPAGGWSTPFPDIDSDRTLVVVFGAPEYRSEPGPFGELAAAFPTSHIFGCSTAGEISGTTVADGTLSVAIARFGTTRLRCTSAPVASVADSEAAGRKVAESLLEEGKADFVSMGRASIADPELPNKVRDGRLDEILPCVGCWQGWLSDVFGVREAARGAEGGSGGGCGCN